MSTPANRSTYHHGDLRNALVTAGAALAERGGPDAVGVRAAAREVGVSPTAAYRHFENADELLVAVKDKAFQALLAAMEHEIGTVPEAADPGEKAARQLEALGRAYVKVALAEPGLFRVAFSEKGTITIGETPDSLALVARTLDDLVAAGRLSPERRPMAEFAAWAGVHGLARLVLDGPLSLLPGDALHTVTERVIDMVIRGLTGDRESSPA